MFKVVKGQLDDNYGYQQVLFKSMDVDDCFNFISARKNSEVVAVRKTADGMYVVDAFGDVIKKKKSSKKTY